MARTGNARTLHAAMIAPSTTSPDVVVIDSVDAEVKVHEAVDPKKDLWISTVDGRHQSSIIPLRVGPHAELFSCHRDVLTKSEYFKRALDGQFAEAGDQAIDLPEEDPTIFSFVVAFLYEGKFEPIKPIATVLSDVNKGKGKECNDDAESGTGDSDSGNSGSDDSVRSQRRRETLRRRQERAWEQRQRKDRGRHRPECTCIACEVTIRPPCWNCGVPGDPPPQRNPGRHPPRPGLMRPGPPRPGNRDRHRRRPGPGPPGMAVEEPVPETRLSEEDLRTWSLTYSLSVEVYVCAERYMMNDLKDCVSKYIINSFEVVGLDAAQPIVLQACKTLHSGLSPMDPLLRKIFARVGFLQAQLWKHYPDETSAFLMENADIMMVIMKEMVVRKEEDVKGDLPAMEKPLFPPPPRDDTFQQGPRIMRGPYR